MGINNSLAGVQGGKVLGQIIKSKWDCKPDEVVASGLPVVGVIDTERTGGMITGIRHVCPNITKSQTMEFDGDGEVSTPRPKHGLCWLRTRPGPRLPSSALTTTVWSAFSKRPSNSAGQKTLLVGVSLETLTRANVDPHLLGSVFDFLEAYPEWAVPLLKEISAGPRRRWLTTRTTTRPCSSHHAPPVPRKQRASPVTLPAWPR